MEKQVSLQERESKAAIVGLVPCCCCQVCLPCLLGSSSSSRIRKGEGEERTAETSNALAPACRTLRPPAAFKFNVWIQHTVVAASRLVHSSVRSHGTRAHGAACLFNVVRQQIVAQASPRPKLCGLSFDRMCFLPYCCCCCAAVG